MSKDEQLRIVENICKNLIIDKFKEVSHKIPEDWNGKQLAQWVADKAQNNAPDIGIHWTRKEKSEYNNDVLTKNL